jgi:hypothetical protein
MLNGNAYRHWMAGSSGHALYGVTRAGNDNVVGGKNGIPDCAIAETSTPRQNGVEAIGKGRDDKIRAIGLAEFRIAVPATGGGIAVRHIIEG